MSAVVCGIDEAGLGPLLGPLVLGWSTFELPDERDDPWKLLARTVAREPKRDAERLVVADSKRVFTRNPRGARRLEATALAFRGLASAGELPASADAFLDGPFAPTRVERERHPWYAHLPAALPLAQERGRIELRLAGLTRTSERASVRALDGGVRVVPAGALNDSFDATGSKSATLWALTSGVLRHLWTSVGERDPLVTVDRHGGRTRYGSDLARTFPDAAVRLLLETPEASAYELVARDDGVRRMRVAFATRGDAASFPVALASCFAKFARELVMGAFNAYFGAHQPDLRPTAGYTTDGRRWLDDAGPALAAADVEEGCLRRRR